ncbi:MAG: glycosyltransferase [Candidatus Melainabacteria bacterium]|nr:glycosyltransferase [Candidatus Melainabacteria bacterium]
MAQAKHILITTLGSLGDLHPLLAIGQGLLRRGHCVTIATSRHYQNKVLQSGLKFAPLGPEPEFNNKRLYQELFHPRYGPERLIRQWLMPALAQTTQDLEPLMANTDCLINSPLVYPGPVLATAMNIPWAAIALQPMTLFSAHDPPVIPALPITQALHSVGADFWKPFIGLMQQQTHAWAKPLYQLRKHYGVSGTSNPMFSGQFSPHLNLALFSSLLGWPQPDWPESTRLTGFCFYQEHGCNPDSCTQTNPLNKTNLPEPLKEFLTAEDEPPIVFTLGSSAVNTAGDFFKTSLEAAEAMGCRALLLAGENATQLASHHPRVLAWPYAPYEQVFSHARLVVHQGGAGTTAQVLRAGKPMIIVPYGFDQQDNAARMQRLGVSCTITRQHYQTQRVLAALQALLNTGHYAHSASLAQQHLRQENGIETACLAIESTLLKTASPV